MKQQHEIEKSDSGNDTNVATKSDSKPAKLITRNDYLRYSGIIMVFVGQFFPRFPIKISDWFEGSTNEIIITGICLAVIGPIFFRWLDSKKS